MHSYPSALPIRQPYTSTAGPESFDPTYSSFYQNSSAPHANTDVVIVETLRKTYPDLHLTITPTYSSNLLAFAAGGHARATPSATESAPESSTDDLKWRRYVPPFSRASGSPGALYDQVKFGRFTYEWKVHKYIVYCVVGAHNNFDDAITYLLGINAEANDELLLDACKYWTEVHDEVLVFDGGFWQKSHKLWESVQKSTWDDVILDPDMKRSVIGEISKFFGSQERYQRLKVPWKRGVIFYGPPGNGKTISLKAIMHTLSHLDSPIPTLYVRSLASYGGPEYSISTIFSRARQQAPCLLVFEDLDSIVTDNVRSYFLNEVDGLESNDGILMIGSTNHLERLDPGIAKRPSRFDRKYLFPEPGMSERIEYCHFWRKKLGAEDKGGEDRDGGEVEFPSTLCNAIASITNNFSFAYMQEAFVASLLAIAASTDDGEEEEYDRKLLDTMHMRRATEVDAEIRRHGGVDMEKMESKWAKSDLDQYQLWRQMKKQVRTLREEIGLGTRGC